MQITRNLSSVILFRWMTLQNESHNTNSTLYLKDNNDFMDLFQDDFIACCVHSATLTTAAVSLCLYVSAFDPVTLMMRWPAWHHPQGIVVLAPLTDYRLRTGRHHHEAHQNRRGRPRKMTGVVCS